MGSEWPGARSAGIMSLSLSAIPHPDLRGPETSLMARILVGITGGIAAYKACELIRLLVQAGHDVYPLPTPGAERFVAAETFFALARKERDAEPYPHLRHADLLGVAPLDREHAREARPRARRQRAHRGRARTSRAATRRARDEHADVGAPGCHGQCRDPPQQRGRDPRTRARRARRRRGRTGADGGAGAIFARVTNCSAR